MPNFLFLTNDCMCKIVHDRNLAVIRKAQKEKFMGELLVKGSLVQVLSVNQLIDFRSIEIHEGKVLDIEFRDGREIVTIKDCSMAKAIEQRVKGLYQEKM